MTWLVLVWLVGWYRRAPMLWTNNGYKSSVIFSLFAKSSALSKGILMEGLACTSANSKLGIYVGQTHQTPLRCIGPILTTCRIFSLLRIPSRRPRVMPATFKSFVPFIIWLSAFQGQQQDEAGATWQGHATYLLYEQHRFPLPRLESTRSLRPPIT